VKVNAGTIAGHGVRRALADLSGYDPDPGVVAAIEEGAPQPNVLAAVIVGSPDFQKR